eukprot:TRINITY_DN1261_c0_g1_i7.p2 TRINITY_DN1261_c0_g1~~TRINITY_DN1261_c0_g1_i7.p2  ORF type:complete len:220 (+),score=-39.54 TRINITY_DN1261_c0_g1_i7:812-1471(+)
MDKRHVNNLQQQHRLLHVQLAYQTSVRVYFVFRYCVNSMLHTHQCVTTRILKIVCTVCGQLNKLTLNPPAIKPYKAPQEHNNTSCANAQLYSMTLLYRLQPPTLQNRTYRYQSLRISKKKVCVPVQQKAQWFFKQQAYFWVIKPNHYYTNIQHGESITSIQYKNKDSELYDCLGNIKTFFKAFATSPIENPANHTIAPQRNQQSNQTATNNYLRELGVW